MNKNHEICGKRNCTSWNECDDYLKSCIDRSKFVNKIRKELREKRREIKISGNN